MKFRNTYNNIIHNPLITEWFLVIDGSVMIKS